jgi:hypothetical protein
MRPDWLFVGCGAAALLAAVALTISAWRHRRGGDLLPALLWALFGAGLIVQGFAPHLAIERNAFRIPMEMAPEGGSLRPADIVASARRLHSLSALLTVGAGLGLALAYRRLLVRSVWRPGASASDQQA